MLTGIFAEEEYWRGARIFSHRLTWLKLQPTSPFQLPMRVYARFSLLVLLLSVWQVKPKSTWVPEAGTVAAPCTIMQLCTLHLPGPLTFCLTALLVRQLLPRDGMGILEYWPAPQHALFESYRIIEIFQQLEVRVCQLSSLSRVGGTVSPVQLPSQYNHAPPSVPL